jgi:xanthine dehydrogenase YagS FAD-binding subunit
MSTGVQYLRPPLLEEALELLTDRGAAPLAGGTDLIPRMARGKVDPSVLVDLREAVPAGVEEEGAGLHIGAGTTLAALAAHPAVARYAVLAEALAAAASPQLRVVGTVGGNLAQAVRCWYYRHPDLTCWLNGGDTCYAAIGDHRKHGLEPGDCLSVAPSDLAAALGVLGTTVEVRAAAGRIRTVPLLDLYRRPDEVHRSAVALERGELITAVTLPGPPDASRYERAGERAAWSFALCGVAAARYGSERRLVAIGVTNEPRALDPQDPLAGLPGLEQTGWKRRLLAELSARALAAVA